MSLVKLHRLRFRLPARFAGDRGIPPDSRPQLSEMPFMPRQLFLPLFRAVETTQFRQNAGVRRDRSKKRLCLKRLWKRIETLRNPSGSAPVIMFPSLPPQIALH